MEAAIESFHINLEETRNKIIYHAQSNFQSGTGLQECHRSLSTVYRDVQHLFDAIPLEVSNSSNEVWYAMIENCKLKASQLAIDLCTYVTSTSQPPPPPPSSDDNNNGSGNESRAISRSNTSNSVIRTYLIDQNGIESQSAIAQIVELTIRLIVESQTPIIKLDEASEATAKVTAKAMDEQKQEISKITQRYTAYQRSLLRHRSKPSIENIAQIRRYAKQSRLYVSEYIFQTTPQHDDEEDDDEHDHNDEHPNGNEPLDREEYKRYCKQPYAHAITVILGEASSLLHPLMMWTDGIHNSLSQLQSLDQNKNQRNHHANHKEEIVQSSLMEMCANTIDTVHLEAEHLSISIGNWFLKDNQESFASSNSNTTSTSTNHRTKYNSNGTSNGNNNDSNETGLDLTILDNSLDEMAYLSQVIHRYCNFAKHIAEHIQEKQEQDEQNEDNKHQNKVTLAQHLQEQSLFYSTTETKLTNANLNQAFKIAKPVEMILGMEMYAPSIVDDVYFISTRALERASGTLEHKAIWTVALWIVDVWSVDEQVNNMRSNLSGNGSINNSSSSIYRALLNNLGCTTNEHGEEEGRKEETNEHHNAKPRKENKGFSFSSALIDAIENTTSGSIITKKDSDDKAPRSGGGPLSGSSLLNRNNVDVHKVEMDTQFCTLNGINAASSACLGLAELFETLGATGDEEEKEPMDEKTTSMIKLAKEQMESHSKSYKLLLQDQSHLIVVEWCGTVHDTSTAPPLVASLRQSPCMHRIYFYISNEEYNLNSSDFHKAETDERLEKLLLSPLRDSRLLAQVESGKCDEGVTIAIVKDISCQVLSIVLNTILNQRKAFSEWGSLLLSKQVRLLEKFFCSIIFKADHESSIVDTVGANTSQILDQFQKIKQTITILQLDKPSDWAAFAYTVGESSELNLSQDEIRAVMLLRQDWSKDKIDAVCNSQS